MTLRPTVGPPTAQVLVSGLGFDPFATVDIYFDSTHLAQVTTNGVGAFGGGGPLQGIAVHAPASAPPGNHWILALERGGRKMARKQFLVRTDWAQYHFDAGHSGLNPYENVLSPANVGGLQLDWTYPTRGVVGSPVVANGVLYVGSQDKNLYALNATTGALVWKYITAGAINSSPAVANGIVYVSSGNLYALNATTGELLWTFPGAGEPTVANGVVYFLCDGVCALDGSTGALLWRNTAVPSGPLSVGPHDVVFGATDPSTGDGMFYALDPETGALVWSHFVARGQAGGADFSTPALTSGSIYVGVTTSLQQQAMGSVFCLEMGGGVDWAGGVGGTASAPALGNGMVYDAGSGMYWGRVPPGLSAFTMGGSPMWRYRLNVEAGPPAVANGVVYFAADGLYALDGNSGAPLWQYPIGASSPVIANGVVYVGSSDGNVYAFHLAGR